MSEPWVGSQYETTRLLLLGESAYSWIEDGEIMHPSPRHAVELVEDVIANFPTNPFMTKLSRALAMKERPSRAQLESAWARAAFANYVAGTVGEGPRLRPTAEMWLAASAAFPSLLSRLLPKNIIVLGKRDLWKNLPKEADVWLTHDVQGYKLPNGEVAMCWCVNHPSAGLSWRRLTAVIKFACDREIVVEDTLGA